MKQDKNNESCEFDYVVLSDSIAGSLAFLNRVHQKGISDLSDSEQTNTIYLMCVRLTRGRVSELKTTNKMWDACTSSFHQLWRRDLSYVSENKGFNFLKNTVTSQLGVIQKYGPVLQAATNSSRLSTPSPDVSAASNSSCIFSK